ncbi:hypothetical protein RDABS01_027566 [Bienertia sinuspersici]
MDSKVKHNSEWFIKPKKEVEESKKPYHLAPSDLALLSLHYIQGPGARLCQASALDVRVSDILLPNGDIPSVVASFFDYNEVAVNYDGYKRPLLSVQVTELFDGVFVACSINHSIADGTSYWHFWNVWSEIHLKRSTAKEDEQLESISSLPIHNHWFPEGCSLPIPLPFTQSHHFVKRFQPPELREKIFHFSSESVATLKAEANSCQSSTDVISSFQSLSALVWRAMVRANQVPHDQVVYSYIYANNRHRLNPPLPEKYFGNCIQRITTKTTAGELIRNDLEWTASLLNESVGNLTDKAVREFVKEWLESPFCYHHVDLHDYNTITMEHSPRFNMYGNEFGLGKPVAVRIGPGNKAVGVVFWCPGYEGGGSIDLEICLPPDSMKALEIDQEFMRFVSLPKHMA